MTLTQREREVVAAFGRSKTAVDPALLAILGAGGGAYAGHILGPRLPSEGLQKAMQAILTGAGGYAGKSVGEALNTRSHPVPQGAPYALDPTDQDIPQWALQGARYLQPALKTGAHERWQDMVFGELPGYGFVEGGREGRGVGGALRGGLGSMAAGIGGAGAGLLAGKGIAALLGKDPNVPLINLPLSHIISGLGGTLGATKGFQHAIGV